MTTKTEQHTSTSPTPGPWEAHDDDGTGTLPCVLSDKVNAGGGFYVAQCNNFEDAKLIAATPELLDWLRKAVQMARQQDKGGEDVPLRTAWAWLAENGDAAIAAAEGR